MGRRDGTSPHCRLLTPVMRKGEHRVWRMTNRVWIVTQSIRDSSYPKRTVYDDEKAASLPLCLARSPFKIVYVLPPLDDLCGNQPEFKSVNGLLISHSPDPASFTLVHTVKTCTPSHTLYFTIRSPHTHLLSTRRVTGGSSHLGDTNPHDPICVMPLSFHISFLVPSHCLSCRSIIFLHSISQQITLDPCSSMLMRLPCLSSVTTPHAAGRDGTRLVGWKICGVSNTREVKGT